MAHREDINLFPYTLPTAIKIPKIKPEGIDKIINLIVTKTPSIKGGKRTSCIKYKSIIFLLPTFHKVQLFCKEIF